jgi:HemY protein
MAALVFLLAVIRAILRSPRALAAMRRNRRGMRAYEAISSGLIAIGAGDVEAARKFAYEVNRLAPGEPLALLLAAQSAQLAGDRAGAEQVFRAMAGRDDTKAFGLHGLFIEARRRDDHRGARAHAEEAARASPTLGWAARAVLEGRSRDGDWAGALVLLEQNQRTFDKANYRRQRAVLLTACALALEDNNRDAAKVAALEAVKLAPTLVPAAALAGRLLAQDGELRKASRIVAKAWSANPHPELAQTYAELRYGDAARDRLGRVDYLVKKSTGHMEGALALARAALDAREFGKARAALAALLAAPTRRVALLMAEIERADGDEGRAREWLARALHAAPDPAWTADGHVSDRWLPISPVTGRIDAFEWRVPLTEVARRAPVIEPEPPLAATPVAPAEAPMQIEADDKREPPAATQPATRARAPEKNVAPSPRSEPAAPPKAEPIIPLVHAPDDPGPDLAEGDESSDAKSTTGWRKIFE